MSDALAEAGHLEIIFHNDDETSLQFILELLHSVFEKQLADALRLTDAVRQDGRASCGTYPREIAAELLEAARQQVRASGYPLRITSRAIKGDDQLLDLRCKLCGELGAENQLSPKGTAALICDDCMVEISRNVPDVVSNKQFGYACDALRWHFAGIPQDQLAATSRQFPGHMRADVQAAVDRLFSVSPIRFFGIHEEDRYETLTISTLTRDGRNASAIAPAQYHEVDVGENVPVKCLDNGLWLCATEGLRYAVVLSAHRDHGREPGTRIEIAVPVGAAGAEFVQRCFSELENAVNAARCYRGKVLSLESSNDYRGSSKGITVHKLPAVRREDVILPETTLKLLDRNVLSFVGSRERLRRLGQSTRKGILLYGPPGTGKTHTIRYLASNLPGHTTLIITAAQIGLLPQYMSLARLLQPTMVVIEDADLIARDRTRMGPCEESMLNGLLNEMDGLKQDADILFVLTTNRPEDLESALASRPGRIDQAIEVPLPDDIGRRKLVQLYGRGLPLDETIVAEAAQRTKGVHAQVKVSACSASAWSRPPSRRTIPKGRAPAQRRQEATMVEPDRNGISARLWRLPGQLLRALINATAILVIVAAILALVAIARIDHFAENVVATMTEAVLSKIDLPSKDVLANLRNLTEEVRTLGNSLREIKAGENPSLQSKLLQLKEALTVLNISVDRLGSARSIITDEAIGQLGRTVTDTLMKLRDCSSSVGQTAPHRTSEARRSKPGGPADSQEAGHES